MRAPQPDLPDTWRSDLMARKDLVIDPRIGNDRVGLMVTRGQGIHIGHTALQAQMLVDNSRNTVALGSSQKSGEFGNPFTTDQKRRALQGLWDGAFKIIELQDIGASDRASDWADYVLDRIARNQLPEPTDLYAGSITEARWYRRHFADMGGAPAFTRGAFQVWENGTTGKRIHILDRDLNIRLSASQVRTLIEQRDPSWRAFVPARLWDFYEWEYPPELRAAVEIDPSNWAYPEDGEYPVGTKLVGPDGEILVLRDDGKWRPRTPAELGKSMGD
jgi:nicotinamide mononucleotide adenylyltransferase